MKLAYELLAEVSDAYVIGDSAYDAKALVDELQQRGCVIVIPSNPTRAKLRELDRHLYRERALVENFFQKIKCWRRIAMRFEKLARWCGRAIEQGTKNKRHATPIHGSRDLAVRADTTRIAMSWSTSASKPSTAPGSSQSDRRNTRSQ